MIIMASIVVAVVVFEIAFAIWDSYYYPNCPQCENNFHTSRRNGRKFCKRHGYI